MSQPADLLPSFFVGKRVFLTGHTGFMGSWLAVWLDMLGSKLYGYALRPPTMPNLFEELGLAERLAIHRIADVRDGETLTRALQEAAPDVVFHLAAQSLVLESYKTPKETFDTNVLGTVNLLEAVRQTPSVKACVVVTSDKCYRNQEWEYSYREGDQLGGADPYSASKACAELVVDSYRASFFSHPGKVEHQPGLATARAGNVIGGGDWAPDRIIPDCIDALLKQEPIRVRRPRAMRPWQHVLEPISGYLWLTMRLAASPTAYSGAWNFGPLPDDWHSVRDLVATVLDAWGTGTWSDASEPNAPHEAGLLRLSIDKAQTRLNWLPVWNLRTAVARTVEWYRAYYLGPPGLPLLEACQDSIRDYQTEARTREIEWAQ